MPNDRWKSVEREAARLFGTERIPRDGSSGADFKTSLVAVEVKTRTDSGPLISVFAAQALLQAEEAVRTEPELKGLIPFALLHSKGSKIGNSFCIIRAENLAKLVLLAEKEDCILEEKGQ
jgi:hypothetical protein